MNLKKIRAFSAVGVWASIAYLVIAILYLAFNEPHIHARYMLYGVLVLFPYSVAVAYVASSLNRYHPSQLFMVAGVLLLVPTPLIALLYGEGISNLLVIIAGLLGFSSSLYTGSMKRGNVKLSLELVAISSLWMSIIAMFRECWTGSVLFSYYSLAMTAAYPVTLIYAVTINSLPSTFKDRPHYYISWILPILTLASGILELNGDFRLSSILLLLSAYGYLFSARVYRLNQYWRMASGFPRGPARAGALYFLEGHLAVIALVIVVSVYSFLPSCSNICLLHLYTLGFTSLHVIIHGPMMLPVILGIRHRRRFNPAPFIFQVVAVVAFPFSGSVALGFYLLTLLSSILVVI